MGIVLCSFETSSTCSASQEPKPDAMDFVTAQPLELTLVLVLGVVTFLFLWVYNYSLSLSSKPGVPKGRFWQIPLVGETLILTSGSFEDFLRPRVQRYGRNFRTHLLGNPAILVTSFDKVKFVLQSPHLFKRSFAKATRDLMAGDVVSDFVEKKGGIVLKSLSRSSVRRFIPLLDMQCRAMLAKWEKMVTVPFLPEMEKFAFTAACVLNCDYLVSEEDFTLDGPAKPHKLQSLLFEVRNGLLALPVNLPGTRYHRALKARRSLEEELMRAVIRRKAEKRLVPHQDLLESFLEAGESLPDGHIVEIILGFIFAALETSASAISWILIELSTRPELVALLHEENDRFAEERRRRPDDTITLEDIYEKLPLTNQVLQETLRLRNIATFATREVLQDVVHEGMLFPKGWKVLVTWVGLHKDSNNHSNPDAFDPSRFADASASKPEKYMPFATGPGYCKGQDAFKLEGVILLHYLLSGYDFELTEKVENLEIAHWPTPRPLGACPITISRRRREEKKPQ